MKRTIGILLVAAVLAWLATAAVAYGWAEGDVTYSGGGDCVDCHRAELFFPDRFGPHGGYAATSNKCAACHDVHESAGGGYSLLPAQTTKDNCLVCHDGSGGYGVYGAIEGRGLSVGASHSIDATNLVPGGSILGGSVVMTFTGENGYLSCEDCHSVHGASVVATFGGERVRFHVTETGYGAEWATTKLLRRTPRGSDTSTSVYGSDWCIGCHRGRRSGLPALMNHPVDSAYSTSTPFYYQRVSAVVSTTSLLTTITGLGVQGVVPTITWSNLGFVMPSPRTPEQQGHSPICQQCHKDSRIVGSPGAVADAYVIRYGDGTIESGEVTDNPRFQTFPHETVNANMLVETYDDLCTNCHEPTVLP